jgi:phosphoglycolate phosphatase-like HAD superfamily hydrolase
MPRDADDRQPLPDLLGLAITAFLFDLDGVVTRTAAVHARAWKELFDSFLAARAGGGAFTPFRLPGQPQASVSRL